MAISDEHYRAIGRISVEFGEIEMWVSSFAWALIDQEQSIGQIVTAGMSFSRQLDLLSSLFQHRCHDTTKLNDFNDLTKRLSKLSDKRNTIIHSLWLRQSKDSTEATRLKITAKRKPGLSHTKKIVKPQELESIADDFHTALSDFSTFMTTYLADK